MKKQIIVVLEIEKDDEVMMSDDFIKRDLECEIDCTSNSYEIVSIDIKDIS